MSTEPEHETPEETPEETAETFIRALGRPSSRVTQSAFRQPAVETPQEAAETKPRLFVTQGPRTQRVPRPLLSPDDLIRGARGDRRIWTRIF